MSPIFALLGLSLALCGVFCDHHEIFENEDEEEDVSTFALYHNPEWPSRTIRVGQIGGVAFKTDGNALVFHRASRKWNDGDFDENGVYTNAAEGKIKEPTLVVINGDGKSVESWGADLFYMPHGLTVDHENNVWVTDVAAHQVFKFAANDKTQPALVLGESLKPGSDDAHFCQPTDIAVASNGDFFVADGYCNSRVMKFDKTGKLLAQFGAASTDSDAEPGTFSVPHSLALVEDTICVADRENARVQCFDAGIENATRTGALVQLLAYRDVERIYAIAYDKVDMMLHGLSVGARSLGFSVALNEQDLPLIKTWGPRGGFNIPHDIAVSLDGQNILVGDLAGKRLHLFNKVN